MDGRDWILLLVLLEHIAVHLSLLYCRQARTRVGIKNLPRTRKDRLPVQEVGAEERPRCLAVELIVRNQWRDPSLFSPKLFSVATLQIILVINTTMVINTILAINTTIILIVIL